MADCVKRDNADWEMGVVAGDGVTGGCAVRFLGPHRHTVVEIPATVLLEAVALLPEQGGLDETALREIEGRWSPNAVDIHALVGEIRRLRGR